MWFKKRRNDVGLNQGETVGMERCEQIRDLEEAELTKHGDWLDGEEEGEVVVKDEDRLLALALNGSWSHPLR